MGVFKYLDNARMVVLESRNDHLKTEGLLKKLKIPYQKEPSKAPRAVVTTQPKPQPWTIKYWEDVPKIRVEYSLCEKGKQHQKNMFKPFNLVLSSGPFSHSIASKYTESVIVGYPKYDNFFHGLKCVSYAEV